MNFCIWTRERVSNHFSSSHGKDGLAAPISVDGAARRRGGPLSAVAVAVSRRPPWQREGDASHWRDVPRHAGGGHWPCAAAAVHVPIFRTRWCGRGGADRRRGAAVGCAWAASSEPEQGRGRGQRRTALAREGSRWVGRKTAGEGPDRSANRRTRFACSPNPTANGLTGVVAWWYAYFCCRNRIKEISILNN